MTSLQPATALMQRLELLLPPPLIALVFALLMWFTAWLFPFLNVQWLNQTYLGFWIGALCFVIGAIFGLFAIFSFRKQNTTVNPKQPTATKTLVCHGVYAFSRNPMYLGAVFILLGWAIFLGNLITLLWVWLFKIYITRFQIMPEERILSEKFPTEFQQYQEKVRRWF